MATKAQIREKQLMREAWASSTWRPGQYKMECDVCGRKINSRVRYKGKKVKIQIWSFVKRGQRSKGIQARCQFHLKTR